MISAIGHDSDQVLGTNPLALETGETLVDITGVSIFDVSSGINYWFTSSGSAAGFTVTFVGDQVLIEGLMTVTFLASIRPPSSTR